MYFFFNLHTKLIYKKNYNQINQTQINQIIQFLGKSNKIEATLQVRRALLRHQGIYKCNAMHSNHFNLRIRNKRITNITNTKKSKKLLFPSTIIDVGGIDDENTNAESNNNKNDDEIAHVDDIDVMEDGRVNEVTIHATSTVTDIPVEHHLHHHHDHNNGHHAKNSHPSGNQSDSRRNQNNNHFSSRDKLVNEQNHNRHHEKGRLPPNVPTRNEVTTSSEIEISLEPIIKLDEVGADEKSPATEWAPSIHHHQHNNHQQQQPPPHHNTNNNQHLHKNTAKRIDINNGDDDNDNEARNNANKYNGAVDNHDDDSDDKIVDDNNNENNINNHYGKDDEDISVIKLNGQLFNRGLYDDNIIRNTQLAITDENPTTDNDNKNINLNTFVENKSSFVVDHIDMVPIATSIEHNNHTTDLTFTKEFITKCIKCLKYTNNDNKIVVLEDVMGQSLVLPTPPISIQPTLAQANLNVQKNSDITTAPNSLQLTNIHSATTASPFNSNNIHNHIINNNNNKNNKASYTNNINRNDTINNVTNTTNTKIQKGERHMLAMFFIFFIYFYSSCPILFFLLLVLLCFFST